MFLFLHKLLKNKHEKKSKHLAEQCRELNNLLTNMEEGILEDCLTDRELAVAILTVQAKYNNALELITQLDKIRIYSYWVEKTNKRIQQISTN